MANIFGKEVYDYPHLMDAKNADKALYDRLLQKGFSGQPHRFNALGNSFNKIRDNQALKDAPAQGVTWLSYNVEAMQSEIEQILYTDFRLNEYFPIITNIPEGASSYYYRVVDHQGQAEWIENYGTNAPTASITAQKVPYKMTLAGIVPQWSREDVREAVFGGIPLDSEVIQAATTACMEKIERVGLGTDVSAYYEGLLNLTKVPIKTEVAQWNTLTPDQTVYAIQQAIVQLIQNTQEIFGRNIKSKMALYVSIEMSAFLDSPRASFSDSTIWDYVATNNQWTKYSGFTLERRNVQELSTAGVDTENRVLLGYPTEQRVWEMGQSISPRVIQILNSDYSYRAPMEFKISGLNVKRPGGLLYIDNVFDPAA